MGRMSDLDIDIQMELENEEQDAKTIALKLGIPVEWVEEDIFQPVRRRNRGEDYEDRN